MTFSDEDALRAIAAFEAAPFQPDQWLTGLDLFARAGGGWAGQLLSVDPNEGIVFNVMTRMPADAIAEWERRGGTLPELNPRASALYSPTYSILSDDDFLDNRGRGRNAFYQELFRPFDAEFISIGKLGHMGGADVIAASVRSTAQGHADAADHARLTALLPHFAAALHFQSGHNRHGLDGAVASLEALQIPAFFCNQWGRVVAATAAAETLIADGALFALRGGLLTAADRYRDADLQAALRSASRLHGRIGEVRQSTLVLVDGESRAHRVDVAPMPPGTLHFTAEAVAMVAVYGPSPVADATVLLRRSFDLTPTEAEIALEMARGRSAGDVAERRSVSVATVRAQMQAILSKTGMRKASALASMLGKLGLID